MGPQHIAHIAHCSASIRKPGFEAELNRASSVKSPEPPSIKRAEDLKNTLVVSTILRSRAIQRGRITVILHSPVVLTPRRWKQSSLQRRGICITAKSFLARVPLPLCRQTACSCIVMGCPPSLTKQLSGAAPAPALLPEQCGTQTASLIKTPYGFLLISEPGNGKSIMFLYSGLATHQQPQSSGKPSRLFLLTFQQQKVSTKGTFNREQ